MEDNKIEWDNTLKIVSMAHNTMKYEGIGHSLFQLTFGRELNIPSMLNTTLSTRILCTDGKIDMKNA